MSWDIFFIELKVSLFFGIFCRFVIYMIKKLYILFFIIAIVSPMIDYAQSVSNLENKVLYKKEKSGYVLVHTQGWGLGYSFGKCLTYFKKRMFEFEFATVKHPKEKKVSSFYDNSKSYVYGKLNYVVFLRGGIGRQRIINGKPYWGGVEVRYFYYGGINVAMAKPMYVYVYRIDPVTNEANPVLERFDPNSQSMLDIAGKGPFLKGIDMMSFYGGVYGKFGFSFEYGADDRFLKSLDVGVAVDAFPFQKVPIMAFNSSGLTISNNNDGNEKTYLTSFVNLYLAIRFGRRSN